MSDKVILHCDLNNFFASVELLDKPELRDKPCAVCGSVEERHGIVLAKNDVAKKYGIVTAQPVWQAQKLCPDLILLEPHYDKYSKYSKLSRQILYEYTDIVEPFSIDESWLDVTGSQRLFGSGEQIANKIRRRHKEELGLTVSVGVSFCKIFAKLGSDMKKPDAVTCISKENFKEIISPLPVRAMMGIGPATSKKLEKMHIYTLGELANTNIKYLKKSLGVVGETLYIYANGLQTDPVMNKELLPAQKSISRGVTPARDIENTQKAKEILYMLAEEVFHELIDMKVCAYSVSLEIRDSNLKKQMFTRTCAYPLRTSEDIVNAAMNILRENCLDKLPLRSIGVGVGDFASESDPFQTNVFSDPERSLKHEILERRVDTIRRKYGKSVIGRATLLGKNMPRKISTFSNKNKE